MPKKEKMKWSSGHRYSREELLEVFSRLAAIGAIQDPIMAIKNKIRRKAWFEGVILAAVLLESLALARLKRNLKGKVSWKRLEHLSFEQVIIFLYGLELIGPETYRRMMRIRDERNKLVHKVYDQYVLDNKKAEKLMLEAIKCFEDLTSGER